MTVEDGSGLSTSNSYASIAEFRAYCLLRDYAVPVPDTGIESALIRATMAIDAAWLNRWPGQRKVYTQALCWPRECAYDELGYPIAGIPVLLKNAICEASWVEFGSPGALTKKAEGGIKRVKVGPIEKEFASASSSLTTQYPTVSQYLLRLVGSSGMKVIRV
jgi:hypothetical protein